MEHKPFDWDRNKNLSNVYKHGVSFEEAEGVFNDPNSVYLPDLKHSDGEERFLIIGFSEQVRILTVCHCYRENDVIRIISARNATIKERKLYGGQFDGR